MSDVLRKCLSVTLGFGGDAASFQLSDNVASMFMHLLTHTTSDCASHLLYGWKFSYCTSHFYGSSMPTSTERCAHHLLHEKQTQT